MATNTTTTPPLDFETETKMISQVNAHYNKAIVYKNQPSNDGKGTGGWQLENLPDGGEGDCDTYARTKGEALIRQGFDPKKLAIVVARQWNGVDHALLRVDRGDGKFVYLSNPQNKLQAANTDASIMDELPGKDSGVNLQSFMWGPLHDAYKERREKMQSEAQVTN